MATLAKGNVERLPSGSLRVRVYGGRDPVTGKEHRYRRTVKTEAQAAAELARLLRDVEAERAPDDSATVGLLLDRYLHVADLEVSTRRRTRAKMPRNLSRQATALPRSSNASLGPCFRGWTRSNRRPTGLASSQRSALFQGTSNGWTGGTTRRQAVSSGTSAT